MSAKLFSRGEWLLEIYQGAGFYYARLCAERGFSDRFAGEIGRKTLAGEGHDGKAAAIHRDALRDRQRRRQSGRMNTDAAAGVWPIRAAVDKFDGAEVFNDAGKHFADILPRRCPGRFGGW